MLFLIKILDVELSYSFTVFLLRMGWRGKCWLGNSSLLLRATARGIFRSTREDLLLRSGNLIKEHAQGKQVIKCERAINRRSNEYTHMLTHTHCEAAPMGEHNFHITLFPISFIIMRTLSSCCVWLCVYAHGVCYTLYLFSLSTTISCNNAL